MEQKIIARHEMEIPMTTERATLGVIHNKDNIYHVMLEVGAHKLVSPQGFKRYSNVKKDKDALKVFLGCTNPSVALIMVDRERVNDYMYGEVSEAHVLETRKEVRIQWFSEVVVATPASRGIHEYPNLADALTKALEGDYVLWTIEEAKSW